MEPDDPDAVLADDGAKDEIELDDSEEVLSVDDDDGAKEEIELDDSDDSFAEDDGAKDEIELEDSELLFTDGVVVAGLEAAVD